MFQGGGRALFTFLFLSWAGQWHWGLIKKAEKALYFSVQRLQKHLCWRGPGRDDSPHLEEAFGGGGVGVGGEGGREGGGQGSGKGQSQKGKEGAGRPGERPRGRYTWRAAPRAGGPAAEPGDPSRTGAGGGGGGG